MSLLEPPTPTGWTLVATNVYRPDDGTLCDLYRTAIGYYVTRTGTVMRTIDQRVAARMAARKTLRVQRNPK